VSKTRKRIIVTVDTDLTDKQIEGNGVTVYMPEPEGDCHQAIAVEVERARPATKMVKAIAKASAFSLAEVGATHKILGRRSTEQRLRLCVDNASRLAVKPTYLAELAVSLLGDL
jgi:hypothetical protein